MKHASAGHRQGISKSARSKWKWRRRPHARGEWGWNCRVGKGSPVFDARSNAGTQLGDVADGHGREGRPRTAWRPGEVAGTLIRDSSSLRSAVPEPVLSRMGGSSALRGAPSPTAAGLSRSNATSHDADTNVERVRRRRASPSGSNLERVTAWVPLDVLGVRTDGELRATGAGLAAALDDILERL